MRQVSYAYTLAVSPDPSSAVTELAWLSAPQQEEGGQEQSRRVMLTASLCNRAMGSNG